MKIFNIIVFKYTIVVSCRHKLKSVVIENLLIISIIRDQHKIIDTLHKKKFELQQIIHFKIDHLFSNIEY